MNEEYEELWAAIPEKAAQPTRVEIIEAMWWIDLPISPVRLVDVFDGKVTMWQARSHLEVLRRLRVVELVPEEEAEKVPAHFRKFFLLYRLTLP